MAPSSSFDSAFTAAEKAIEDLKKVVAEEEKKPHFSKKERTDFTQKLRSVETNLSSLLSADEKFHSHDPQHAPSIGEQVAQGRGYTGSEPKQLTEVVDAPGAFVPEEPKDVEPTSKVGTDESKSYRGVSGPAAPVVSKPSHGYAPGPAVPAAPAAPAPHVNTDADGDGDFDAPHSNGPYDSTFVAPRKK